MLSAQWRSYLGHPTYVYVYIRSHDNKNGKQFQKELVLCAEQESMNFTVLTVATLLANSVCKSNSDSSNFFCRDTECIMARIELNNVVLRVLILSWKKVNFSILY